jgi:FKBP-type peptidyl-prolyl cis-trans isomerase FklB
MKLGLKIPFIAAFVATAFVSNAQQIQLKSTTDSLSYSIGVNIGQNIKQQGLTPNVDALAQGIRDVLSGATSTSMDINACNAFIQNYFQGEQSRKGQANKKQGEDFLTANKTLAGVVTLPSGLQYKVLTEGTGAKAVSTDKVTVHYEGKLIDGTVFDSSIKRGEPATFGVTQVIKGWVEALQLMPVGSKWQLYIPSELAYGQQGPPSIGPNQVLIFDVELLEIAK